MIICFPFLELESPANKRNHTHVNTTSIRTNETVVLTPRKSVCVRCEPVAGRPFMPLSCVSCETIYRPFVLLNFLSFKLSRNDPRLCVVLIISIFVFSLRVFADWIKSQSICFTLADVHVDSNHLHLVRSKCIFPPVPVVLSMCARPCPTKRMPQKTNALFHSPL